MAQHLERRKDEGKHAETGQSFRLRVGWPSVSDIAGSSPNRSHAASIGDLPRSAAKPVAPPVVSGLVLLGDVMCVFLSAPLSLGAYRIANLDYYFDTWALLFISMLGALSTSSLLRALDVYEFRRMKDLPWQVQRTMMGWSAVMLAGLTVAFFSKTSEEFSRLWILGWFAVAAAALCASRLITARQLARWAASGRLRRRIAVVGSGMEGLRLVQVLQRLPIHEVYILGVFEDRTTRAPAEVAGIAVLGNVNELVALARRMIVDEIIVALPPSATHRIEQLRRRLRALPVDITVFVDFPIERLPVRAFRFQHGIPVAELGVRPLQHWRAVQKRAEDILAALLLLALFGPFMAMAAVLVKLDSNGPILFRQKRFGFNNDLIEVMKFRTMFAERCDAGENQAQMNDPRITRVGRWLRRLSLDELPQLFNVLEGSMSIVGPRPHPVAMKAADQLYHEAVDDYFARHRVKPGITGLAQVNGCRGETDTLDKAQQRIDCDLRYIEEWSLLLDLEILLRTPLHMMSRNAY